MMTKEGPTFLSLSTYTSPTFLSILYYTYCKKLKVGERLGYYVVKEGRREERRYTKGDQG
jgi:hypothetical protein